MCLRSSKFNQNWWKLVLKCKTFFKKWKWDLWSWKRAWKGGSPEPKFSLIKGVLRAAHPCTTFQCEYHPPWMQVSECFCQPSRERVNKLVTSAVFWKKDCWNYVSCAALKLWGLSVIFKYFFVRYKCDFISSIKMSYSWGGVLNQDSA